MDNIYIKRRETPKRVLAVHDLSAFGRCALTVIMPVLSAMGHQCVPLPTALLSTHTGGFNDLYFLDLSDSMTPICDHFESLKLEFDAIYTGFLGSEKQIGMISALIDRFGSNNGPIILVDPVMGDDGVLYSTYNDELVRGMRSLCGKAQIITPNLTEACFLTEKPCLDTREMNKDQLDLYIGGLFKGLMRLFRGRAVITGIVSKDKMLTAAFDGNTTEYFSNEHIPVSYPGTGDIFASVILGELLSGHSFSYAVSKACDFISVAIKYTIPLGTPIREGVAVEKLLHLL